MADGLETIPGPRYDINLADVGRAAPQPADVGAAVTNAFKTATNLIETRWLNNYSYQMAQLNLKAAASKLQYQDQYNDILKQQYDQQNQLFPETLKQQQQVTAQNQIGIDQLRYNNDQDQQAQGQLADAQKDINGLDPDALDYWEQRSAIKAKYPQAFNRVTTAGQLNSLLGDKDNARSRSSVAQLEDSQIAALEQAQQNHVLPTNMNARQWVVSGRVDEAVRMANQQVLTNRVQTILQNSRPGTDSYNWANEMLNVLRSDPSRANQLFDSHGLINDGVAGSLNRYEKVMGITPTTGPIADEVKEEYDKNGKLVKRTRTYKNVDPNAIPGQEAPNEKKALPQSPADVAKDPVFQQLMRSIPPELAGNNATDAQRKDWVYNQYLRIKGQPPQNQQTNQPVTTNQPAQGFVTGQPTPTPTPAPKRGRKAEPAVAAPPPGMSPPTTYPQVRLPRPQREVHVIAPSGERRHRPLGAYGYQEGGYVSGPEEGTDNIPANLSAGEYVMNRDAVDAIGTENLDAVNQSATEPQQAPAMTQVQQTDPFTLAFNRARQATDIPDQLLGQLLGTASEEGNLPYPSASRGGARVTGGDEGRAPVGNYGVADAAGNPALHALAYGPQSEGATAADMRQVKGSFVSRLQPGDIAVSPNLLGKYPPLSRVNVVGPDGRIVMQNARVADTSWYSEGRPTSNTFEIYNGPSLGAGYHLVPATQGEAAQQ